VALVTNEKRRQGRYFLDRVLHVQPNDSEDINKEVNEDAIIEIQDLACKIACF
jgi:hypothetical protein